MEWIPVKERMPDDPSWVLVYADGAINCMGFHKGQWRDWTMPQAGNIVIGSITHWMPLPDGPSEEMTSNEN